MAIFNSKLLVYQRVSSQILHGFVTTPSGCSSGRIRRFHHETHPQREEFLDGQNDQCIPDYLGMGQNPIPLVNIKIAGKWMFIP